MEPQINFNYRQREHKALYTICEREFPTFVYITFLDPQLKSEFGEEVVLHCTAERLITEQVYTNHRLELYQALYEAIRADETIRLSLSSPVNNHQ
jgi:hypothetical protein